MTHMRHILLSGRAIAAAVAFAAVCVVAGCNDVKQDLLEAPNPGIIDPSAVQSAAGAIAVRNGALARLRLMTTGSGNAGSDGTWLMGGLLADEWSTSSTFVQNDETDERQISANNSSVTGSLRAIYRVPLSANQAVELLNKYRPTPASDIAEMYFVRGFAYTQLASDFCNGIPLSDATTTPVDARQAARHHRRVQRGDCIVRHSDLDDGRQQRGERIHQPRVENRQSAFVVGHRASRTPRPRRRSSTEFRRRTRTTSRRRSPAATTASGARG